MAAQGEHVDAARILLYHKAPVDEVTVDYLTALHVGMTMLITKTDFLYKRKRKMLNVTFVFKFHVKLHIVVMLKSQNFFWIVMQTQMHEPLM